MEEDFKEDVMMFYATVYGITFVADNAEDVEDMVLDFEKDEWKNKRLHSWVIKVA